jgi:phthalate 4,5-dioxygenase
MLTKRQNELVTRTDAGTPLGDLMRRYWLPAALAEELAEPDGAPVRVRLLGERLVAFRDTSGRIGLVQELCAHRCASLFLGRNEENGLRCAYHGWKYDVHGNCVDMPTEAPTSKFKSKIHLRAYPTVERGDVVWAYLGAGEPPAPPDFEWARVAPTHRMVTKIWQECNWLQALEGGIDSIHATLMHRALVPNTPRAGTRGFIVSATPSREDVYLTDYGFYYGSVRRLSPQEQYVRVHHFVMPFHTFFPYQTGHPGTVERSWGSGHMFVPMDDENCMVYNLVYSFGDDVLTQSERERLERQRGRGPGEVTADYRKVRNITNDWMIDRQVQKTETFTGIDGINTQDHAIQESMGPIVDRTQEHLGSTDKAVIAARRVLLDAIKTQQQGGEPPGLGPSYYTIRPVERFLLPSARWQDALRDDLLHGGVWRGTGVVKAS